MEFFERPVDLGVGYWGIRTSALDWCESNYTWSFFIAEFFNTITSLPAAFIAFNGILLAYKYGYDKRFVVLNILLACVGLGSAAFHGTLLYTGQILDELPMVYASLSFLHAILEMESEKEPINKYLIPSLLIYSTIFTAVYFYLPSFFIFFVLSFICLILILAYRCSLILRKPTTLYQQKILIVLAIGGYIGGWIFFWIPDVLFCDHIQALNFHSWWHITSTIGAFSLQLFAIFQRELFKGRKPEFNYNMIAGIPMLPYIHIPLESENPKNEATSIKYSNSMKKQKNRISSVR